MNALQPIFAVSLCLFALSGNAGDVWGQDGDFMEDDSNAKVQRHIAKQRAREAHMSKEERQANASNSNGSCGSLDVGNVQGKGRGDVENIVIIKGDVINANNNCR